MSDDLFPGFESHWIDTEVGRVFARSKGTGQPLVLLHGFPQTHAMWHHLAPTLAETHRVVCMDLRGYGWSSAPKGDPKHETYSKRAMGRDVIQVMEALGHVHFAVVGHDRGARVGVSARARPSGPRRAARPPRHPADLSRVGADAGGHDSGGPLGLPVSALSEAGGGDRARSDPLFRGLDAAMVRRRRSQRLRSPRAPRLLAELQRARPHPRLLRGLPGRRDPGHRGRRGRSRRRQDDPVPDLRDLERLSTWSAAPSATASSRSRSGTGASPPRPPGSA